MANEVDTVGATAADIMLIPWDRSNEEESYGKGPQATPVGSEWTGWQWREEEKILRRKRQGRIGTVLGEKRIAVKEVSSGGYSGGGGGGRRE